MEILKLSLFIDILLFLVPLLRADINRTGCNRTVEAGDVLANPLLTGYNKGRPYNCWFLVSHSVPFNLNIFSTEKLHLALTHLISVIEASLSSIFVHNC